MDVVQDSAPQNAMAVDVAGSAPVESLVEAGAAVVVTESAPVEEGVSGASGNLEDGAVEEDQTPGQSKALKELITQRRKRQEAERELAYYKGLAEGRGAGRDSAVAQPVVPQAPAAPAPPPRLDDFESWEEFETANRSYMVQEAKRELVKEFEGRQEAAKVADELRDFHGRIQAAAETDPRILELVSDQTLPVSKPMATLIQKSDIAHSLLRYLDSNRADASRIASMDPILAAREMGILEARIRSAPAPQAPKKISQAPAPVKTVQPDTSGAVDEDSLPTSEWIRRRNAANKTHY